MSAMFLVLAGLNLGLIGLLPRMFFDSKGRKNVAWWATASPFFAAGAVLGRATEYVRPSLGFVVEDAARELSVEFEVVIHVFRTGVELPRVDLVTGYVGSVSDHIIPNLGDESLWPAFVAEVESRAQAEIDESGCFAVHGINVACVCS